MVSSKKKVLSAFLSLAMIGSMVAAVPLTASAAETTATAGVSYSVHQQTFAWEGTQANGIQAGITGASKRLEAVKINLTGAPAGGSIQYQVHQQSYGWEKEVSNGAQAGVTGKSKRLEAIQITLQGMTGYSVQYRVHQQTYGWEDWKTVKNGTSISDAAIAGVTGQSKRLEAIEIKLVPPTPAANSQAASITTALANPISGQTNVVLVNAVALLQATVKDASGNPVPNALVVFTAKSLAANSGLATGNSTAYTDASGVATIPATVFDPNAKATTVADIDTLQYTATVAGSANIASTNSVKFAAINTGAVTNVNFHDTDATNDLVPSSNVAAGTYTAPAATTNTNGGAVEYVASQQVSTSGSTAHQVIYTVNPQLSIPADYGTPTSSTQKITIGDTIGPVVPYMNTTKTYTVPAGVKYATLNFSKIQIPDTAVVSISERPVGSTAAPTLITSFSGPQDLTNYALQLPNQANATAENIFVTVTSAGQVETDKNAGITVDSLTYVSAYNAAAAATNVALPDATITWSAVTPNFSIPQQITAATVPSTAWLAGAGELGASYNATTKYTYSMPVFPYTGDAVITATAADGSVAYYLIPTVNNGNNVNVIDTTRALILVTKAEATAQQVGTVTANTNGTTVTVNSNTSGSTELQGVIKVPSFGSDAYDATNSTVYTSVNWAPTPAAAAAAAASKDAYALVGQTVTVKAQLTDANGNAVATQGVAIALTGVTAPAGSVAFTQSNGGSTDANGQVTLTYTAGSAVANVTGITATAANPGYKVVLSLSDSTVASTLNLYWVALGLSYDSTVGGAATTAIGTAATAAPVYSPNAGEPWTYQFQVAGASAKAGYAVSASGVPVSVSALTGSVGSLTPSTTTYGAFAVSSSAAGTQTVQGSLAQPTGPVTFTLTNIADGSSTTYNDVGTGSVSLYSNLTLPIVWKTVGETASIVTPETTTIASTEAATTVYAKLVDKFGNPITGAAIHYTITGIGVAASTAGVTNSNGLVAIPVANAGHVTGTSIVTVTVDGQALTATVTLNWVAPQGVNFALVNIGLNSSGSTDVLGLTFSEPVNPNTVATGEFLVSDGAHTYAVQKADVNGNVVYLTLANSNAHLAAGSYTVMFQPAVVSGVSYALADVFGRVIPVAANGVTLTTPASPSVSAAFDGTHTVTVTAKDGAANVADGTQVALVVSNKAVDPAGAGVLYATTVGGVATFTLQADATPTSVTAYYNGVSYSIPGAITMA